MNKEHYRLLMAEYEAQRMKNAALEDARLDEIRENAPDVAALVDKRHQMILGGIQKIFENGKSADVEQVMRDYNARIREALVRAGYDADYLQPQYRCPICRDTGLVGDSIRTECQCFIKRLREMDEQDDGGAGFERFDPSVFPADPLPGTEVTQRMYMKTVRKKCEQYADAYPEGLKNLCLHGSSGLGKTFLMRCVAKRLRERGLDAVYVTAYKLLDDLRSEYFRPGSRDTQAYFEADLLLIDDLGMEPLFESITVETFYNVLNERTLRNLGTAVSTNLSRVEMEKRYTERFTSRLLDGRVCLDVPFYGKDLRLRRPGAENGAD